MDVYGRLDCLHCLYFYPCYPYNRFYPCWVLVVALSPIPTWLCIQPNSALGTVVILISCGLAIRQNETWNENTYLHVCVCPSLCLSYACVDVCWCVLYWMIHMYLCIMKVLPFTDMHLWCICVKWNERWWMDHSPYNTGPVCTDPPLWTNTPLHDSAYSVIYR